HVRARTHTHTHEYIHTHTSTDKCIIMNTQKFPPREMKTDAQMIVCRQARTHTLTDVGDAILPADDVGVALVHLAHALDRDLEVVELADVPAVHGDGRKDCCEAVYSRGSA